jgi:hypothetical protein
VATGTLALVQWFGCCAIDRPASSDALAVSQSRDAVLRRYVTGKHAFSIDFKELIAATVDRLLIARFPTHVSRLVASVVIDAANCVFRRRAAAHISQERREAVAPAIAHRNTAPAIVRKRRRLRIKATLLDRSPRVVFQAARPSVSAIARHEYGRQQASTALRRAVPQIASVDRFHDAARASASPVKRVAPVWFNRHEKPKATPGQVDHATAHVAILSRNIINVAEKSGAS